MSYTIEFDWSQGGAFIQEGIIFYSPNCSRTVLLPERISYNSPFETERLGVSMFKQPVWWTDVYGWQSFIPLAPSYTSSPFEPFCWMPRIIAVNVLVNPNSTSQERERRYQMHPEDCFRWKDRERLLVEAAGMIRIWFKIPGNLPPPPSKFNYDRPHKSHGLAKKMISLARDWFAVWMGFTSYLIACTKRFRPSSNPTFRHPEPNSPIPVWYQRLEENHNYPTAWLDGLMTSNVCSYDSNTPRAGVVFEWSKADRTRPDIKWFLEHNIPMWFVWSKEEERAVLHDRSLAYLKPPNDIIQSALSILLKNPSSRIPLAGLIISRYYNMGSDPVTNETVHLLKIKEAPSFVMEFTTKIYLSQGTINTNTVEPLKTVLSTRRAEQRMASIADAELPTQSMIDNVNEKGTLFDHWQEFLDRRQKRQEEIIRVESSTDRQRRTSREQKPSIKNANVYTWERIQSSGGKEVYMRLRVNKKRNEDVFASYGHHQRIYNALANEWDLYSEFGTDPNDNGNTTEDQTSDSEPYESDFEDDFSWSHDQHTEDNNGSLERCPNSPLPRQTWSTYNSVVHSSQEIVPLRHDENFDCQSTTPPSNDNMDISEDDGDVYKLVHCSEDVVEYLNYGYGYVASITSSPPKPPTLKEWELTLLSFGFAGNLSALMIEDNEKNYITDFCKKMANKTTLPEHSDDLNSNNHLPLRHLFDFAAIHRPSKDLFVFSSPRSMSTDWLLGVNSPEVALYICRYILSNPGAHTILTVASRLLDRGIPFRTLLGMDSSHRHTTVSEPYSPSSYRLSNHVFKMQDFEASMLRCQAVLSRPQGRAALLQGGIIWRIAKEFLSVEGVLDGPSVEATTHRLGYMHESGTPNVRYCDNKLTENEIAIICGTYSLYTSIGQVSVKSWFPPPACWNKDRAGVYWPEWTPRNEQFFEDLMVKIRAGKAEPLSVFEWTSRLRGFKAVRNIREYNRIRATSFLDELVPTPTEKINK